jgi:hypothetical protein
VYQPLPAAACETSGTYTVQHKRALERLPQRQGHDGRSAWSLQVTKLVVSFADIPGIRDKLPQMAQQLDVCQRALSDFLEDKRSSFPRCAEVLGAESTIRESL